MTPNDYQTLAGKTADYPDMGNNLLYPALGVAGEAGEVADKVKKYWRNHGKHRGDQLTADERHALIKELGDVAWYIAAMATELKTSFEYILSENIYKLRDRGERGVIKSEGDER